MSDESNTDARDILSELENSEPNSNNVSNEQSVSEIPEPVQSCLLYTSPSPRDS